MVETRPFRIDTHVHTGERAPTENPDVLKSVIQAAHQQELNGIFLTDHNKIMSQEVLDQGANWANLYTLGHFTIIPGMEVSTFGTVFKKAFSLDGPTTGGEKKATPVSIHIGYASVNPESLREAQVFLEKNKKPSLKDVLHMGKDLDLTVTIHHPLVDFGKRQTKALEEVRIAYLRTIRQSEEGDMVHALEVYSGRQIHEELIRLAHEELNWTTIGSSDAHEPPDIGRNITEIHYGNGEVIRPEWILSDIRLDGKRPVSAKKVSPQKVFHDPKNETFIAQARDWLLRRIP